ncbi:haloacid dehalogenase type II [Citricoccus nitrophenolicus]|uniref:haloacid dehalogenase type II n=1 Tax=Citricoccus nitrophenolicus TaxID=863575 RepID=UPI0031E8C36B
MAVTPSVIVFDVNETLSDMSVMEKRFVEAGAPAQLAKLWFAILLRDGFALAVAGDAARFADIGTEILEGLLSSADVDDPKGTAATLASSVADLPLHPDVPEGIRGLRAAGHRLVTLSNGSPQVAERLVEAAGIDGEFERFLSVEDAPAWKPHPFAYRYAAEQCRTREDQMLMVAMHAWDIHGAARAGLRTAWVNRTGASYPSYYARPDLTVASLTDLEPALTGSA